MLKVSGIRSFVSHLRVQKRPDSSNDVAVEESPAAEQKQEVVDPPEDAAADASVRPDRRPSPAKKAKTISAKIPDSLNLKTCKAEGNCVFEFVENFLKDHAKQSLSQQRLRTVAVAFMRHRDRKTRFEALWKK